MEPNKCLRLPELPLLFIFKNVLFYLHFQKNETPFSLPTLMSLWLTTLAQMVACLPLVQQVRGSIPGGVVKF